MAVFRRLRKELKAEDYAVAIHMVMGLSIGMSIGIAKETYNREQKDQSNNASKKIDF